MSKHTNDAEGASVRAQRASAETPACDVPSKRAGAAACPPAVSSHTGVAAAEAALTCTALSASSAVANGPGRPIAETATTSAAREAWLAPVGEARGPAAPAAPDQTVRGPTAVAAAPSPARCHPVWYK